MYFYVMVITCVLVIFFVASSVAVFNPLFFFVFKFVHVFKSKLLRPNILANTRYFDLQLLSKGKIVHVFYYPGPLPFTPSPIKMREITCKFCLYHSILSLDFLIDCFNCFQVKEMIKKNFIS